MSNQKNRNIHPVFVQFIALLKELDQVIEKHVQRMISELESESLTSRENEHG